MASGHVNRSNRPNTWRHRPATPREDFPCQLGAVHTWRFPATSQIDVNAFDQSRTDRDAADRRRDATSRPVAAMNPPQSNLYEEDCAHSGSAVTSGGRVSPVAAKR